MTDLVAKWKELAKRDDVLDQMVPSDLRQLITVIERLTPDLPEANPKDGPCCHQLIEHDGEARWRLDGCYCGNYDDAAAAAGWAAEMNSWLKAQEILAGMPPR